MKPFYPVLIATVVLSLVSTACRNPVNARTAERYIQAGGQAEKAGDLVLAQKNFYRSYQNTVVGNLGPGAEAAALYEWSRVTGYLGMYADAEWGFTNALALVEKSKGEADKWRAPVLCELARMLRDTNEDARAVPVFERALQELESKNILRSDPIGFAEFLDDFATSLKNAGFGSRSEEVARRAAAIRKENPGESPKFKPKRYAP